MTRITLSDSEDHECKVTVTVKTEDRSVKLL